MSWSENLGRKTQLDGQLSEEDKTWTRDLYFAEFVLACLYTCINDKFEPSSCAWDKTVSGLVSFIGFKGRLLELAKKKQL